MRRWEVYSREKREWETETEGDSQGLRRLEKPRRPCEEQSKKRKE